MFQLTSFIYSPITTKLQLCEVKKLNFIQETLRLPSAVANSHIIKILFISYENYLNSGYQCKDFLSLGFCKNIAEYYDLRLPLDNTPLFSVLMEIDLQ